MQDSLAKYRKPKARKDRAFFGAMRFAKPLLTHQGSRLANQGATRARQSNAHVRQGASYSSAMMRFARADTSDLARSRSIVAKSPSR